MTTLSTSGRAAAGALLAGPAADRFGRKALLITDALIYALGAILSAVTPNAAVLLFARTLIGLVLCLMAIGFVALFLPETKGHSVDEIVHLFERQRATGAASSARAASS